MAIIEENTESLRKCDWCGKAKISPTWSGKKGIYCSFRCSSAGSYRTMVAISVLVSMMTCIVVIIFLMMAIAHPTTPIPFELLVMPGILVLIDISFIYSAFVGRSMRKERNTSL